MSFLRPLWKFPLMLLWSIVLPPISIVMCLGKKGDLRSLKWTRFWARGIAKMLNLKITVNGDPDKFQGGMIVSNHQSAADIFVHASLFQLRFAPKKELKSTPVVGFLVSANHPIWIDRSSPRKAKESAQAMIAAMQNGASMIVYPEGTTSNGKEGLLPFKSTAFEAALEAGRPILPILTVYDPGCESSIQWVDHRPFFRHLLDILSRKEIKVTVHIMDEVMPLPGEDRKALALRLHDLLNNAWEKRR